LETRLKNKLINLQLYYSNSHFRWSACIVLCRINCWNSLGNQI